MNPEKEKFNLLDQLENEYPFFLNPELFSLNIVRTKEAIYLEKALKSNPEEVHVLSTEHVSCLSPKLSLEENIIAFFELDSYSIIMCFDDIFTEEAIKEILNSNLEDKTR